MRLYKLFSLTLAVIFAVVGLIFLFFPDSALIFFNSISSYFGLPQSPVQGTGFYLILASAYMYLVTLLAYLMYRYPEQNIYPFFISSWQTGIFCYFYLSILYVTSHYLIYFANFVIDGFIGLLALYLMKMKKTGV